MSSIINGRSTASTPNSRGPHPPQMCDICHEESTRFCTATCGHTYCGPCLREHIKHSIDQEATFPVSCCGKEIPFDGLSEHMPPHLRLRYNAAAEQYTVPSNERVFCAGGCGLFLGSSTSAPKLLCKKCKQSTCTACKTQEHEGQCSTEAEDATLKTLAQAQGWQVCTGCSAMVELSHGCNHISCRCGHEFCYPCGAVWKTCKCQQFQEHNVQEVLANEIVNQAPEHRHDWYAVPGRAYCQTCRRRRHQFRCRGCPTVSCGECRYPGAQYGLWY